MRFGLFVFQSSTGLRPVLSSRSFPIPARCGNIRVTFCVVQHTEAAGMSETRSAKLFGMSLGLTGLVMLLLNAYAYN
jgi:hypothetical protein